MFFSRLWVCLLLCTAPIPLQAATYNFQSPQFTAVQGTRFSTSDSISGSLQINNPPLGGACSGLGSGAGDCDITSLTLTATGSPSLTLNLGDAEFPSSWNLFFDASGNITDWGLQLSSPTNGTINLATSPSPLFTGFGAYAQESGNVEAGTPDSMPGVWTLVPEPTTGLLALLSLGAIATRRFR